MTDLTKTANGERCQIRVPDRCKGGPVGVCLCHVRLTGISGMSYKAPDLLAAFGCEPCHDIVDGRMPSEYTFEERRLMLLEGVMRTQEHWIRKGVVRW